MAISAILIVYFLFKQKVLTLVSIYANITEHSLFLAYFLHQTSLHSSFRYKKGWQGVADL
jgi:hypothetical protein